MLIALHVTRGISFDNDEEGKGLLSDLHNLHSTRFAATQLAKGQVTRLLSLIAIQALKSGLQPLSGSDSSFHIEGPASCTPIAAIWLLLAGEQIHKHCIGGNFAGCRNVDIGYSLENWALWKEGLAKFAELLDLNEDYREFAVGALEKMIEIEEGYRLTESWDLGNLLEDSL